MGWLDEVKAVRQELGCSNADAMKEASARRKTAKGGATWKLSPEEQAQYAKDKMNGSNMTNHGTYTSWNGPVRKA
jgi:hypothetical protein